MIHLVCRTCGYRIPLLSDPVELLMSHKNISFTCKKCGYRLVEPKTKR